MALPWGRLPWLCHSLFLFLHPPWSTECLWRERERTRHACCCSSSRWTGPGCCVEAGLKISCDQHFPFSVPVRFAYDQCLFCTSSARNRSFCRKFWPSLTLSLTVFFFTWVRICLACCPMLSCKSYGSSRHAERFQSSDAVFKWIIWIFWVFCRIAAFVLYNSYKITGCKPSRRGF